MIDNVDKPFYQDTPLALIDTPQLPARETMNSENLVSLATSIRELGLLQPVGLKRNGDRYEVFYGHRRTLACRELQLETVRSIVFPADYKLSTASMLAENMEREPLNPGEEAVWFAELLESMAEPDTDDLARMLKVSRDYVEGRLVLLRGDELVLEALKRGDIKVGVAEELNMIRNVVMRRDYLNHAIRDGATRPTVKAWRQSLEAQEHFFPGNVSGLTDAPAAPAPPRRSPTACLMCGEEHDRALMLYFYIHRYCLGHFETAFNVTVMDIFKRQGEPSPATTEGEGHEG